MTALLPWTAPTASLPATPSRLNRTDIEEMLERLETVTHAGRQHLMSKIVAVFHAHPLARTGGPLIDRRVAEMRREADKAAPDGAAFARSARALLAALTPSSRS